MPATSRSGDCLMRRSLTGPRRLALEVDDHEVASGVEHLAEVESPWVRVRTRVEPRRASAVRTTRAAASWCGEHALGSARVSFGRASRGGGAASSASSAPACARPGTATAGEPVERLRRERGVAVARGEREVQLGGAPPEQHRAPGRRSCSLGSGSTSRRPAGRRAAGAAPADARAARCPSSARGRSRRGRARGPTRRPRWARSGTRSRPCRARPRVRSVNASDPSSVGDAVEADRAQVAADLEVGVLASVQAADHLQHHLVADDDRRVRLLERDAAARRLSVTPRSAVRSSGVRLGDQMPWARAARRPCRARGRAPTPRRRARRSRQPAVGAASSTATTASGRNRRDRVRALAVDDGQRHEVAVGLAVDVVDADRADPHRVRDDATRRAPAIDVDDAHAGDRCATCRRTSAGAGSTRRSGRLQRRATRPSSAAGHAAVELARASTPSAARRRARRRELEPEEAVRVEREVVRPLARPARTAICPNTSVGIEPAHGRRSSSTDWARADRLATTRNGCSPSSWRTNASTRWLSGSRNVMSPRDRTRCRQRTLISWRIHDSSELRVVALVLDVDGLVVVRRRRRSVGRYSRCELGRREPGVAVGAPLHRRAHAVAVAEVDVVAHPDLVAVVDDRRAGQARTAATLSSSILRRSLPSSGASRRRMPRLSAHLRIGGVGAVHVVALLVGHHLERQLVVVAQERRPLAALRQLRASARGCR